MLVEGRLQREIRNDRCPDAGKHDHLRRGAFDLWLFVRPSREDFLRFVTNTAGQYRAHDHPQSFASADRSDDEDDNDVSGHPM